MKTTFKLPALAVLLLCLALPALAQPKPARLDAKPKLKTETEAKEEDPWKRQLPEVMFEQIPLSELMRSLGESHFPEINFVVHNAVQNVPITLRLRAVTLEDIFTAIDISTKQSVRAVDPATGLATVPSEPAFEIKKVNDRMVSFTVAETPVVATPTAVCRAFSLSRYLAGKADKEVNTAMTDIEDALQIAWKMLQMADRSNANIQSPQLGLHRATKLLIVVGQPAQMEVVEQVISQLAGGSAAEGAGVGGGRSGGFGAGGSPGAVPGAPGVSPLPGLPGRDR